MKNHKAQPSLSRDFALLAAAILFVLFLITVWISYTTYTKHSEHVLSQLDGESMRIERLLGYDMETANYLLTSLGRQIILDKERDLTNIAQVLKSFDSRGYIYTVFSFVSSHQKVVVSSNRGILDEPVDISDRDYVKMAMNEPWKMQIGRPIEGRVSGRWIIPVIMGLTDYTGKFVGSVLISININTVTEQISRIVKRDGLDFAIISKTLIPLTQVSENKDFFSNNFPAEVLKDIDFNNKPQGLVARGNLFLGSNTYTYYRVSADYPYIILLSYDAYRNDENVRNQLWSRLLQILGFAAFFVLFMWIMRARMIRPILDLTQVASGVSKGEHYTPVTQGAPVEIEGLATQIGRISEYIEETKRIEDELRSKMFMLKKGKEQAELEKHSKSEFLAYICQELRTPINTLIGLAQVMKDQLYGPIENRKYRQCAADMYQTGNGMLGNLDDLLRFTKTQIHYPQAEQKLSNVEQVIDKSLQLLSEKLATEKREIQKSVQEQLPPIAIEEFRLQQIITNLLMHLLQHDPLPVLYIDARVINENKERPYTVLSMGAGRPSAMSASSLIALAHASLESSIHYVDSATDINKTPGNLNLELAQVLIGAHKGGLHINQSAGGPLQIILFF